MTDLLLAYYGDDFTGSADVMEVMQWAGLRTVLFLDPPTNEQLKQFSDLRAFGVAGCSRTMSCAEMEAELTVALAGLRDSHAPIVHYKTCSTFDSSAEIGSVGKALEIGRGVFGNRLVPMVIAAPNLSRFQVFGNLFARSGLDTEPFRLDRHPTMKRHPITPMAEADLRVHLSEQTNLRIGLFDVLHLHSSSETLVLDQPHLDCDALLFDVLYPEHLPRIGGAIEQLAEPDKPQFLVGSSGVEYALTQHWAQSGHLESLLSHPPGQPKFGSTEQLVVITGSCSPVNARQIDWAEAHGYETIAIHPAKLLSPDSCRREIAEVVQQSLDRLRDGKNVILHSSRGPNDRRIIETLDAFRSLGFSDQDIKLKSGRTLGPPLGRILRGILDAYRLPRVGIAGGDTSGYVARELGITALEAIAPVAPGSPLCRAHANNLMDGVEFFFKGGQVGKDDVWGTMLTGTQ